jgi:hypothetical protein
VFKKDRREVDEAEGKARLLLCDILLGLSHVPKDKMPALVHDLERALSQARAEGNGAVAARYGEGEA